MDTIFMSSKINKTSETQRLLLKLFYKINLKGSNKHVALSNLNMYSTWKNMKTHTETISAPTWNENMMDHIPYLIFQIILSISSINIKQ